MVTETGCDAVMVGRAAASDPWIFRQLAQYLGTGRYDAPTPRDRYQIMRSYYSMLIDHDAPDTAGKMKQFATYFTHGVPNGARLRLEIHRAHGPAQIVERMDRFFEGEPLGCRM
jgi:tRNA-dihydrouridine synthase